jgi:hypothetical protein
MPRRSTICQSGRETRHRANGKDRQNGEPTNRGPEKDSAHPTRLAYSLSMAGMNFCPFPRYGNGELVLRFPARRRPPRAPVPFLPDLYDTSVTSVAMGYARTNPLFGEYGFRAHIRTLPHACLRRIPPSRWPHHRQCSGHQGTVFRRSGLRNFRELWTFIAIILYTVILTTR